MLESPHLNSQPIEPDVNHASGRASPDELEIQGTLSSITSAPRPFRIAAGIFLLSLGVAALTFGTALLHSRAPGTAFIVFLMLEPGGVFIVCIALVVLAPHSKAVEWFRASYFRLRVIVLLLALLGGVGATLLIGSLVLELVRQ